MTTFTLTIGDQDAITIPAPPSEPFASASLAVLADRLGSSAFAARTDGTFRHCGPRPTFSCTIAGTRVKIQAPASDAWTWGAILAATAESAESRGLVFAERLTTFRRRDGDVSGQIDGRDVADAEFERLVQLNRDHNSASSRADLAVHGVQVLEFCTNEVTTVEFAMRAGPSLEHEARTALTAVYGSRKFDVIDSDAESITFQTGTYVLVASRRLTEHVS